MSELLPCPFCGADLNETFAGMTEGAFARGPNGSFGVDCASPDGLDSCGCMGPFKPTMEDAIAAWNTRSRTITKEQVEEAARRVGDTYERFGQHGGLRAMRPSDDMLAALALAAAKAFGLTIADE